MKNEVQFSVVIPTYNRAERIKRTIESVLNQSFEDFEIIVVDDGSTDNTEEIVRSISSNNLRYYYQENSERGAARNAGALKANGRYVTFLDSDDVVYSDHLEKALETIRNNDAPEWLHLGYEIKNENGDLKRRVDDLDDRSRSLLIKGNFLSCNSVFIKRETILKHLFDEDRELSTLEDWELWLRLASQYKLCVNNSVTSAIIEHSDRSIFVYRKDKLLACVSALMKRVLSNKEITAYYKNDLKFFKSSCFTYISLYLALTKKDRGLAFSYLLKGAKESFVSVFSKRTLAIIKHIIT